MKAEKTGILLVNLGTPDSYHTPDVRRYLKQFLLDGRVIDIPAASRNLLVRGIIAPFRAPKSAASYKAIWTEEGSPLLVISQQLSTALQARLGEAYQVELAMRYQNPGIASCLEKFRGKVYKKIKVVPLFPQYASATTGSVHEEIMRIVSKWPIIPDIEFLNSYCDNPGFINAFVARGRQHEIQAYDHILFSYHGLPERQLKKADIHGHCVVNKDCCAVRTEKNYYCYGAQCSATTYGIAEALSIPKEKYTICFQSRLGKTPWKRPYTINVIEQLAQQGAKKVLVFCPSFVTDCLETTFEIGEEYQEEFKHWGGEQLELVESLNSSPEWVAALAEICK